MQGMVYLIGAGPGDPELLTLKAVKVLNAADVVLYDDLVNPVILRHAGPQARLVSVGKRGGCRSTPQAFIERRMVREARAGKRVIRLKGGDPLMFGRGGEEIETLRKSGIPFEVVSGVTSGMAATATLGVPLTHRGCASGVTFVTGHSADGNQTDWAALVSSRMTLVVYMGVTRLSEVVTGLMDAGMSGGMPVLVVQNATLPNQRQLRSTLSCVHAEVALYRIESPAIVVIGEVTGLAAWQDIQTREAASVQAA